MHATTTSTADEAYIVGQDIAATLILTGLVLLTAGVLAAGWEPIELPLGLIALGSMALAMFIPSFWQDDEARDTVNSLVLASLITLTGFHMMA